MSRIGNKPIVIVKDVTVTLNGSKLQVKGPKATLDLDIPTPVSVEIQAEQVVVKRPDDTRKSKAFHGLIRTLINNMIIGVTEGYKKELTIVGIGYRGSVAGNVLTLNIGFSHPIVYNIPAGVTVAIAENTKITITGADKHMVGEVAATIRRFRKPEPYKGKGIRYAEEVVRQKEGKTVG